MFWVGMFVVVYVSCIFLVEFWDILKYFVKELVDVLGKAVLSWIVEKVKWLREKGIFFYILLALALLTVFFAGYNYARHSIEPKVVTRVDTKIERVEVPVEVPVYVKGDTVIEYVEKESPDDADVEFYSNPSKVVMSFNDEKYEMDTLENETHKFDKGKLEVQQSSETVLDVTPIVEREVKIAEAETRKQVEDELNEEFQKELRTKRRQSRQDGFWTGLGTALLIGAGAALAK